MISFFVGLAIGFLIGFIIGTHVGISEMRMEAVKAGVADYVTSRVTGSAKFTWTIKDK